MTTKQRRARLKGIDAYSKLLGADLPEDFTILQLALSRRATDLEKRRADLNREARELEALARVVVLLYKVFPSAAEDLPGGSL